MRQAWARTMSSSASLIGKKLGAYRIESVLGSGGMGDVYRGTHEILGRAVAIKTLRPEIAADASMLKRFFDEARVVNTIRHENIVEVTDLVSEPGGRSYMVMELLEGCTLSEAIRQAGRVPPERAVRIAAQIAGAIAAAHKKGVIHRDLKPDNVFLIRRAGTADYVKILDFGIARLRPELGGIGATRTGALIGTPAYMSPEQAEGKPVGNSADIYALGVILFHMLTGRLPFEGTSMHMVMYGHTHQEPPRLRELCPEVPAALAELVAQALAKKPAERPSSMVEMRAGLYRALGLEPADVAGDAAEAPVEHAAGASMWSGPTVDATSQAGAEAPGAAGHGSADPAKAVQATALARPGKRALPPSHAPRASVDQAARSIPGRAISDTGVHSTPAPPSSSTRPLRARIATPQPMPSQIVNSPKKRLGVWIGAVIATVGAGALSFALVRASNTDGSISGAADSAVVADRDGAILPEAALGQAPAGQDPGEPRQRLDQMVAEHGEPAAPQPCQTRDPDLLARLVSAAGKLAQGGPGSERPQDTEAVRVLSGPAPDQAEYWYWLAKARLYAGADRESIIDATERATKLCDAYAAAYSVAGTAEFRAKDATAAESLYRRALELDKGFHTARYNLGLVQLERGRIAEGIDTFTHVIARDPGRADALVARGQAHLMARDPGSAVRDLERAIRIDPQSATGFWLLAHAYSALNQREDARRALCAAGRLGHAEAAGQCDE
jgi:eukaryotic-like serine/threonine-protein kinase